MTKINQNTAQKPVPAADHAAPNSEERKTVTFTPTWEVAARLYAAALRNPDNRNPQCQIDEIVRMGKIIDQFIERTQNYKQFKLFQITWMSINIRDHFHYPVHANVLAEDQDQALQLFFERYPKDDYKDRITEIECHDQPGII